MNGSNRKELKEAINAYVTYSKIGNVVEQKNAYSKMHDIYGKLPEDEKKEFRSVVERIRKHNNGGKGEIKVAWNKDITLNLVLAVVAVVVVVIMLYVVFFFNVQPHVDIEDISLAKPEFTSQEVIDEHMTPETLHLFFEKERMKDVTYEDAIKGSYTYLVDINNTQEQKFDLFKLKYEADIFSAKDIYKAEPFLQEEYSPPVESWRIYGILGYYLIFKDEQALSIINNSTYRFIDKCELEIDACNAFYHECESNDLSVKECFKKVGFFGSSDYYGYCSHVLVPFIQLNDITHDDKLSGFLTRFSQCFKYYEIGYFDFMATPAVQRTKYMLLEYTNFSDAKDFTKQSYDVTLRRNIHGVIQDDIGRNLLPPDKACRLGLAYIDYLNNYNDSIYDGLVFDYLNSRMPLIISNKSIGLAHVQYCLDYLQNLYLKIELDEEKSTEVLGMINDMSNFMTTNYYYKPQSNESQFLEGFYYKDPVLPDNFYDRAISFDLEGYGSFLLSQTLLITDGER